MRDVHICIGLDKGGSPSSVKIVVELLNQACPNRLMNTVLASTCPCESDGYAELEAMLAGHAAQLRDLLLHGVGVWGRRRAVRLFLNGDYMAVCTVLGHKGPHASLPCLWCLATKAPSSTHCILDGAFGTMQHVTACHPEGTSAHLSEMRAELVSNGRMAVQLGLAAHLSIERPPLLVAPPRQIVPMPLHLTMGVTLRLLRLAIEAVIVQRNAFDGTVFADTPDTTLYSRVGVKPVPYHGGAFIGRHCHVIAEKSECIWQAITGLVPDGHVAAYKRAWLLWRRLISALNQAEIVPQDQRGAIEKDAKAFLALLKENFSWLCVSPKLHVTSSCTTWAPFCSGTGLLGCTANRGSRPATAILTNTVPASRPHRTHSPVGNCCARWR